MFDVKSYFLLIAVAVMDYNVTSSSKAEAEVT